MSHSRAKPLRWVVTLTVLAAIAGPFLLRAAGKDRAFGIGVQPLPEASDCGSVPLAAGRITATELVGDADAIRSVFPVGDQNPADLYGKMRVADLVFDPGTILPWHYHAGPGWAVVTQGSAEYTTAFRHYTLTPGAIFVEPPYQAHMVQAGPDGLTVRYVAFARQGFPANNGRCLAPNAPSMNGIQTETDNLLYPERNDAGILQILAPPGSN
jgi:quercetin dioxygenase-like cupin family protein